MGANELKTILHADSDTAWTQITHDAFKPKGVNVLPHNSESGLREKFAVVKPDLLITELGLGMGINSWRIYGYEYIKYIAQSNPEMPVVYLSSLLTAARIYDIAREGSKFAMVLTKFDFPKGSGQLVGHVEHLWKLCQAGEEAYTKWLRRGFPNP